MTRTTATRLAGIAAGFAIVALWRDNVTLGNDGLTNRRRRYHARQWANGAGRMPTKAEMACLRELRHDRPPRTITTLPPVP